jgi:hypothetical protein
MQNMRTHKYVRCFIVFMSTFIVRHNPAMLAAAMDSVQPGVFLMVLQQVRSCLQSLPKVLFYGTWLSEVGST